MFATLIRGAITDQPVVDGDLVLVEVPDNCTVHDVDAARLSRLRRSCTAIREWMRHGGSLTRSMGTPELTMLAMSLADIAQDADPSVEEVSST